MSDNPVHPKVLGGAAGLLAGGSVGSAIESVIDQTQFYAHLTPASQQFVHGLLVVGLALLGQLFVSYFSKWEPAVSKDIGTAIHVLDADEQAASMTAAIDKWWSEKIAAEAGTPTSPTAVPEAARDLKDLAKTPMPLLKQVPYAPGDATPEAPIDPSVA